MLHALQTQRCVVSAANEAEIIAKSLDRGLTFETITAILAKLSYTAVDTTVADGQQAGLMRNLTRSAGLSLADRLCLALARRLKAKVLTADRVWTLVAEPLGLDVVLIPGDAHGDAERTVVPTECSRGGIFGLLYAFAKLSRVALRAAIQDPKQALRQATQA